MTAEQAEARARFRATPSPVTAARRWRHPTPRSPFREHGPRNEVPDPVVGRSTTISTGRNTAPSRESREQGVAAAQSTIHSTTRFEALGIANVGEERCWPRRGFDAESSRRHSAEQLGLVPRAGIALVWRVNGSRKPSSYDDSRDCPTTTPSLIA